MPDLPPDTPSAPVAALDATAVGLSLLCLLHCLALPLLAAALPLASASFVADERFHLWMLALVLPTTFLAIHIGYRRHRRKGIRRLAMFGLGMISLATLGRLSLGLSEQGDTALTVVGALLLATAHILNLRAQGGLHWHRAGDGHAH